MSKIEPWFSVEVIARHLGVSKEAIYRWLERRTIPVYRMGQLWKFKPSDVDSWVIGGRAGEELDRSVEVPREPSNRMGAE